MSNPEFKLVQNEKPKNWRLLLLRAKKLSSFGLRPYVNEKKTNADDELIGLVGLLENKSTAHNVNETSRSSSNVETSEFDFLEW